MLKNRPTLVLSILAIFLLASVLAGCGDDSEEELQLHDVEYPKVPKEETHAIDTPPAVQGEITEIDIKNEGEVEVTFHVPGYERDRIHVELTLAKWIPEENTWMNMLQRTRERGPQEENIYGDGVKVIRGGNLRLQDEDALTGGQEIGEGVRFTTRFKAAPGDFGNVGQEFQPIDFSDGVLWRRDGDNDPATYGEDEEYLEFVEKIIEEINQYGQWEEEGIYRVGVTERDRGQEYYTRFNAAADFILEENEASMLPREDRKHTAAEAMASDSCMSCHSEDQRFTTNRVHGEQRHDTTVCANCHNDYTWDSRNSQAEPGGWSSLEMSTMTHRIHAGIEGYVADAYSYQEVRFPDWSFGRTPRPDEDEPYPFSKGVSNCLSCHGQAEEEPAWKRSEPDPRVCTDCHTDGGVEFQVQEKDYDILPQFHDHGHECANCHGEGGMHFGQTADEYHRVSERRSELELARSHEMKIVDVQDAVAGQAPTVVWRVQKDDQYLDLFSGEDGTYLLEGNGEDFDQDAVRLGIGWGYNNYWINEGIGERDTGAMGDPHQEVASVDNTRQGRDETYAVTTFDSPLPEEAHSGRDGFVVLDYGPAERELSSELETVTLGKDPDLDAGERSVIVDTEGCLSCHTTVSRHGIVADRDVSTCASCHHSGSLSRDDSVRQGTLDFMYMIHAIHGTGEKRERFDRRRDHTVKDHYQGGYSYVTYPDTILSCQTCHTDDSQDWTREPFHRLGVIADEMKEEYLAGQGVNAPMASTCYSCHQDTEDERANRKLKDHSTALGGDMFGSHDHEYYLEEREMCTTCHQ